MKAKRRKHDPEFKACFELEAIIGIGTAQCIGKLFDEMESSLSRHAKYAGWSEARTTFFELSRIDALSP
jgi:hypothetical protein